MDDSGTLSRAELYDRIRSQIEHEDGLINIRVVWQLLAQSFFFSTYATLLNAKEGAKNQLFDQQQEFLLWAVPIAAILAGVLASISIFTSICTIGHLGQAYRNYTVQRDDKDQSTKLFPAIQASHFFALTYGPGKFPPTAGQTTADHDDITFLLSIMLTSCACQEGSLTAGLHPIRVAPASGLSVNTALPS